MFRKVDLNCDMGESFGAWRIDISPKILENISSANIACGFHAGDPLVMEETVILCKQHGVAVGAHPGLPDLMGFGRREMKISPREARNYLLYQVGALWAFCTSVGVELQHVKLHGAWYNMAAHDKNLAQAIIDGLLSLKPRPILLALSGSPLAQMAEEAGLKVAHEVFADRAYSSDGTLIPRSHRGAVLDDPELIAQRVVKMVTEGAVETIDGEVIRLKTDSVCIHGDNPKAEAIVVHLAEALDKAGISIVPLRELV